MVPVKIIWVGFCLLTVLSCQTSNNGTPALDSSETAAATAAPKGVTGPIHISECPAKNGSCTKELIPVMCSASVYAGQSVKHEDRLVVWGSNQCIGLAKLGVEACKNALQPSLLSQMQCVPDASGGHCPPPQAACPNTVKPVTCTAQTYRNEALSASQRMTVAGSNECLARARLKVDACRANLDPFMLKKIFCESQIKNHKKIIR